MAVLMGQKLWCVLWHRHFQFSWWGVAVRKDYTVLLSFIKWKPALNTHNCTLSSALWLIFWQLLTAEGIPLFEVYCPMQVIYGDDCWHEYCALKNQKNARMVNWEKLIRVIKNGWIRYDRNQYHIIKIDEVFKDSWQITQKKTHYQAYRSH